MSTRIIPNLPRKRPQRHVAAPRPQRPTGTHTPPAASTTRLASDEVVELEPMDGDFVDIGGVPGDAVALEPVTTPVPRPRPASAKKPTVRTPLAKAARAVEPALVEPPTKENKGKKQRNRLRITDNDIEILEAVNWMGRATLVHIAVAVGNTTENIGKRVRELVKHGYLMANDKNEVTVYGLAAGGAAVLDNQTDDEDAARVRSKDQVKVRTKEWALATLAHRNKINTAVCFFKVGGNAFQERKMRELASFAREQERRNARTLESNAALLERQERLRAIPEEQRTLSEHRYLTYRARGLANVPEIPEPTQYDTTLFADPQAALPEDAIKLDITAKGEAECARDWMRTVQQILTDPRYPVRHKGDRTSVSDAERQAMYDVFSGRAGVIQHWNTGEGGTKTFDKRHRPDGVVLRPHQIQPDGSRLARLIWLEVEENAKDVEAVKLVCRQAMDHPLAQRVLYLTNKGDIITMVNDAKAELVEEMMWSQDFNREMNERYASMTEAQKREAATARVNDVVAVVDAPLVNERVRSGLWG